MKNLYTHFKNHIYLYIFVGVNYEMTQTLINKLIKNLTNNN